MYFFLIINSICLFIDSWSSGGNFFIAIGQGSVTASTDSQMIHDSRFNAFREAMQNAKAEYVKFLGEAIQTSVSLSIEENDFKKKFAAEPILFDVMMNSLGTSSNPLVKVSHDSTILQPKGGVYNLIDNGDGNATLGGISISSSTLSDGTKRYSGRY